MPPYFGGKMAELTPEQHNEAVWKKIGELNDEIAKLKTTFKQVEAKPEVTLLQANGDALAERQRNFESKSAAKEAMLALLGEQKVKPKK